MTTTFEKFFEQYPEQKSKFDQEYDDFVLAEFIMENMEKNNLSVRALAKKAAVSPTVIQKLRSDRAESVNYRTLSSVMSALGFQVDFKPRSYA